MEAPTNKPVAELNSQPHQRKQLGMPLPLRKSPKRIQTRFIQLTGSQAINIHQSTALVYLILVERKEDKFMDTTFAEKIDITPTLTLGVDNYRIFPMKVYWHSWRSYVARVPV